jgi:signal peptidase I
LLVAVVLPALVVRGCVLSTYLIRSGSMEPALQVGDHLLVLRAAVDTSELSRWDVVVMDDTQMDAQLPESYEAVVKRVAGLSGERIEVRGGDVWVGPNGADLALASKPDDLIRELLVSVHRADGLPTPWRWDGQQPSQAIPGGGVALEALESRALAHFDAAISEGGLDDVGELVADTALSVVVGQGGGVLLLGLREGADAFRARLAGPADGGAGLTHNMAGGQVAQATGFAGLRPGQTVLFWNVDNGVRLWVDDELVLTYDYLANTPQPPGTTLVNTPELGLERGALQIRSVEVLRDLHYGRLGTYGTQPGEALTPCNILPSDIFLLGDASRTSRDSRHFGAVSKQGILGRPVAIYWPWSRARWTTRSGLAR